MTGLYIHVPLCISRCRYCDFYKMTPDEWDNVALFLHCLDVELGRLPADFAPDTVFIGGGTPTALEPADYAKMLESIRRHINLSNVVEFSSEANPGTLTPEKLAAMRDGGINRVSIGVQSFNDKALRLLGRIHESQEAIDGYYMLREAGFDNVNIDLIQSIPGMTPADILADARMLADLGPEHVSYYNLIYEPGTPMTHDRDAGRISPPGDDEEADNYFAVKALLEEAGYGHYEISNFAKNRTRREAGSERRQRSDNRCLHNVLYWQGGEYFGCGPSAHSHWRGRRFGNIPDLQAYCDRLQRDERPFDEVETLSFEEKARETLVMWLRMTEGVDLARFESLTGHHADALCGDAIKSMEEEGLLQRGENRLALSPEALFVCNAVFSELV
ncbi:radical SAM family heme chaperone HemW [Pontiella sulfatireligans]|uniref:Heme chaperone HemW n=1 Tax=Pontiella sulfatireligans TaxID=2750658 RepID=A0A6C2URP0_9BACT|nr:radical SAM family heme chaperone HemW [Pontiella sulfatireligans]VGO22975.1 Oxygen-independent coproporphyrinogen-III oxidase-like protein YqeR [Pontiella sulfatireligans]